jgi:hypothetical protein
MAYPIEDIADQEVVPDSINLGERPDPATAAALDP